MFGFPVWSSKQMAINIWEETVHHHHHHVFTFSQHDKQTKDKISCTLKEYIMQEEIAGVYVSSSTEIKFIDHCTHEIFLPNVPVVSVKYILFKCDYVEMDLWVCVYI
ncbi:hypothetical protein PGT21_030169 [Puccinia graminis f. sp. tritici]|uniref:Uncharacterized protein n=1 Tax=Puccinia graminis f. sp. tritici TaxID=56615 RepID=A0A5B0PZ12_PUCGR|nr:hypothetical protein PGT21_030169 [Puccinia graminis f. sp. tritici]KAA1109222.1 hypothetical protein PGTUg99_018894 [Puccinia graminis f. sp. tritici]